MYSQEYRCPTHRITQQERRAKDPNQQRFYNSTQWKKLRAIVRAQEPICRICEQRPSTNVDHVDGDFRNNGRENLRALCTQCEKQHTGGQHQRYQTSAGGPFVILVGPAGVGKTVIRKHLAPMLGAVSLGPDEFRNWSALYDKLDASHLAVVECCTVPGTLFRKGAGRGLFVVEVRLSEQLRRERLVGRGHSDRIVEQLMGQPSRLGYEDAVVPDLVVDASQEAAEVAATVAEAFKCRR